MRVKINHSFLQYLYIYTLYYYYNNKAVYGLDIYNYTITYIITKINISVPIVAGITSSLGVVLFSIILVVTVILVIIMRKLWRATQNDNDGGTTYMYLVHL